MITSRFPVKKSSCRCRFCPPPSLRKRQMLRNVRALCSKIATPSSSRTVTMTGPSLSDGERWTAVGQTQEDFMLKDMCITVDGDDTILGAKSKKECHIFDNQNTAGHLHRAFSVFLFDTENKLLLQQRASCKVTFPDVWTNTCCSHQLHGQFPDEVDETTAVSEGSAPGAVAAAVRKLEHELGIPSSSLKDTKFVFLTRLLYCAEDADPATNVKTGWGEHEMDYILFARANLPLDPNPEEVRDVKYVTKNELQSMMHPDSGLRWSPWFRIIAKHFLDKWWDDLDAVFESGAHADWMGIHKLDLP